MEEYEFNAILKRNIKHVKKCKYYYLDTVNSKKLTPRCSLGICKPCTGVCYFYQDCYSFI